MKGKKGGIYTEEELSPDTVWANLKRVFAKTSRPYGELTVHPKEVLKISPEAAKSRQEKIMEKLRAQIKKRKKKKQNEQQEGEYRKKFTSDRP